MYDSIKHIFFDLDRTLWDFQTNSREVLTEINNHFELSKMGIKSALDFILVYEKINEQMWEEYRRESRSKESLRFGRFENTLAYFGIKNKRVGEEISTYYVKHSPNKTKLFAHTHQILNYLSKKYQLHIITNGFEEVQHIKINKSGITDYFNKVITSEAAGAKKPSKQIFEYAERLTNAQKSNSLIIGDDWEADIKGGVGAGWLAIHFNPSDEKIKEKNILSVSSLKILEEYL